MKENKDLKLGHIHIRMTEEERELIQTIAKRYNKTTSVYIRDILLVHIKNTNSGIAECGQCGRWLLEDIKTCRCETCFIKKGD